MDQKKSRLLIGGVGLILLIVIISIIHYIRTKNNSSVTPQTTSPTSTITNFTLKDYQNTKAGIGFTYPSFFTIEDSLANFPKAIHLQSPYFVSLKATSSPELTHYFYIEFETVDQDIVNTIKRDNLSFANGLEKFTKNQAFKDTFTIQKINWNGLTGYSFSVLPESNYRGANSQFNYLIKDKKQTIKIIFNYIGDNLSSQTNPSLITQKQQEEVFRSITSSLKLL
jgi:hypothetical protein